MPNKKSSSESGKVHLRFDIPKKKQKPKPNPVHLHFDIKDDPVHLKFRIPKKGEAKRRRQAARMVKFGKKTA